MKTSPSHINIRAVILVLALCMGLQMTSFVIIMPLFARRFSDFGAGIEALGLSSMAYAISSTLAAPVMGSLADRIGRRPFVLGSLAVYVFAFGGYYLASSAQVFILLRGLAGALTAGLIPAVMGIIADISPQDRRGQYIGIVNGGASAGLIIGPLIGGALYDRWGYAVPFLLSVAIALLTFLLAAFTVPETHTSQTEQPTSASAALGKSPRFAPLAALRSSLRSVPTPLATFSVLLSVSFCVMFAWTFIEPQLMFYVYDDLNWSSSQLGWAISAYGVAMMLGEFIFGQLSDRLGRKPVLILGLALFSAQFSGLVFSDQFAWITASFILAGLGNALYDPALNAFFLDLAPQAHKGRVMGLKSTAGSLGGMIGPALVVLLTAHLQSQVIFLISLALVWLVTLLSLIIIRVPPSQLSELPATQG